MKTPKYVMIVPQELTAEQATEIVNKLEVMGLEPLVLTSDAVKTAPSMLHTVAVQVLQGVWGNGAEREDRLTAAGYDYEEVQNYINKNYDELMQE